MKKKATLRDVATLSGVSTGTVSKYLNGGRIKDSNRISIQNAIQMLDYSPSSVARSFALGKSNVVTLFIITESPIVSSTWVHEQPIIQALNDVIVSTNYNLQIRIGSKDESINNKINIENCIRSKSTDGIVLLSPWEIDNSIITTLDYYDFPFVIIGSGRDVNRSETVDFDNSSPIHQLVIYLHKLGHEEFALIGGFREQVHMMKREKGFRSALKEAGIDIDEERILYGDYSLFSGYKLTSKLLKQKQPPTAIICGNDNIAAGAVRAIKEVGLKVPYDISVSGFDDSVVSAALEPQITTVRAPAYEMGKVAITHLLRKLQNRSYKIPNIILDSILLIKGSTGEAPRKQMKGII